MNSNCTHLKTSLNNALSSLPLVSIVMPAYNHERYVESAIRSIWSVEYRPIEIIVINDGSTDKTLEVLRRLELESPVRMEVIDKPNEGICKTLNLGVGIAKGKYVAFLASDDEFVPWRMASHVKLLETNLDPSIAGCYGQQQVIDGCGKVTVEVVKRKMIYAKPMEALLECQQPFSLQGSTFKTDVVKALGFDESLFFEDWDFFLRLNARYKFLYQPGVAFRYRGHEDGMNRNMARMASARMEIFNKHKFQRDVVIYGVKKFRANIQLANAQGYFLIEDFENARSWLLQSWLSYPRAVFSSIPLAAKLLAGRNLIKLARMIKQYLLQEKFKKRFKLG